MTNYIYENKVFDYWPDWVLNLMKSRTYWGPTDCMIRWYKDLLSVKEKQIIGDHMKRVLGINLLEED